MHHARASRQPPPHPDQVLFRDGRLVSVVHDGRPRSHAVLEVVQAHLAFYLENIPGSTTHRIWITQDGSTVVDFTVAMLIFTYDTSGPMQPLTSVFFLLHVISRSAPSVSAGRAQVVAVICTATLAAMLNCLRPCGMPLHNFPGVSNGARSCCLRQRD